MYRKKVKPRVSHSVAWIGAPFHSLVKHINDFTMGCAINEDPSMERQIVVALAPLVENVQQHDPRGH